MEVHHLAELLTLLLFACGVDIACEWIKIPHSIGLVVVGLGIAFFNVAPAITISKEVIFLIVLPPLLFFGALHMELEHLKEN